MSLADEAGVKVVVLVGDAEISVRSTSHHGGNPVLARLDGLPLPTEAALIEQVAPVLRAVVDARSSDVVIPSLDWQQVGVRWAALAELLRFQPGHDTHEDRVRRKELRRVLDHMMVEGRERGENHTTDFYRDVAALVDASSSSIDSEATLRELSEGGEHADAIRTNALLGLAEHLMEGKDAESQVDAAEAALTKALASIPDGSCERLAAVGTLSRIDRWRNGDALWKANEGRLPEHDSHCPRGMRSHVFWVRGDALVEAGRWCEAASAYEHAYGALTTRIEPLLAWGEYEWLCTPIRDARRESLRDELRDALESKYFERPEQRVSIAYILWWLTRHPADAEAVVKQYAEVKAGDVALIEDVASDLESQICGKGDDDGCSRRILTRPKRPGDEAVLRESLGLR